MTDALPRLLLVDDEPSILRALKLLLRRSYQVTTACDGAQGLEAFRRQGGFPVVVSDLRMPGMDGIEFLARVKERDSHTVRVLLTGNVDLHAAVDAVNRGHIFRFLLKPTAAPVLEKALQDAFEQYRLITADRLLLQRKLRELTEQRDQNALLEELVRERTRALQRSRLDIIHRLGRAAEHRDDETGSHILRMSHMCALLAGAIGQDSDRCELILHASPMHDVGKIGIPDRILMKPGSLSPQEWEIMRSHTTIGAELLSGDDFELLTMAREIALTHHERWDGDGYPSGLRETEIPLTGRIAALCDVYDALRSPRPYKRAWSPEEVTEQIRRGTGGQFDPELCEAFLDLLPEVEGIQDRFGEAHD